MKISNETKIGALTLITIIILFLGFNFLKGKNIFKSGFFLYARYGDTKGLQPSNPVIINGYQVGTVYDIEAGDKSLDNILVTIKLDKPYNIPKNSMAFIEANPLGSPKIEIRLGNSTLLLQSKDTLTTADDPGLFGSLTSKVGPVADNLTSVLSHVDSLLINVNTVLDASNKNSIQQILANLQKTTASFAVTSNYLQALLNTQSGALVHSLNNLNSFTGNLAANNAQLTHMIGNLDKTTTALSESDIKGITDNLQKSVQQLNNSLNSLNAALSTDKGTAGALLNDRTLYNNINATMRSMNTLLDDLRVHPRRYVNVSIFGRKDKGNYLTAPLDSTRNNKP